MFEELETGAIWTDECYWVKLCSVFSPIPGSSTMSLRFPVSPNVVSA